MVILVINKSINCSDSLLKLTKSGTSFFIQYEIYIKIIFKKEITFFCLKLLITALYVFLSAIQPLF